MQENESTPKQKPESTTKKIVIGVIIGVLVSIICTGQAPVLLQKLGIIPGPTPTPNPQSISASIYVYKYDIDSGVELDSWYEETGVGYYTIRAGYTPSGYRLVGASTHMIYTDDNGNPSETSVGFGYEKKQIVTDPPIITNPPVTRPPVTNPPSGQEVTPSGWSTQFTSSDKNSEAARSLSKAFDGNIATYFYYTIWQSEREDASPEISVYFNGETIAKIGIVNGKVTSQNGYYEKARVSSISARIYTYSGTYDTYISVPDSYSQQCQKFSLGGTYTGVTQIDLFFNDFYKGQGSSKYEMNISEIKFYN